MTVRICSHRLSMQSDALNDQQSLSNEIDCSSSLPTTLIYSGLKLHPKPLVPTILMPSMANPLSIVKKLSLSDAHVDNPNKTIGSSLRHTSTTTTPSSIRLVTSSAGFSTAKTYIFNPQQNTCSGNSSSLVTLIPPGTSSSKFQSLISSNNDLSNINELNNNCKTTSFLTKNRLTLVQPLITNSASSSSTSGPPKLVIQQNSTSNIWSQQSTTKILSAKMLSHPVQLISSLEHSNLSSPTNESPIFTTKTLDSGHQAFIHMSLLPLTSTTESINPVQLTNFYSTPSSIRLATSRSMDHNNNHSITTPIVREMQIEEKLNDTTSIKSIHQTKHSVKNRARLPLQPSTQQISSILPSIKKHKLPDDEHISTSEPPNKLRHYEQFDSSAVNGKKIRKPRHRSSPKISIENATPNVSHLSPSTSSIGVDTTEIIISKKRSSAELDAAAILSNSYLRKKRIHRKTPDETTIHSDLKNESNLKIDPSIETINDELLKRLSQDFVHVDQRTGLRWIGTKTRLQPMNSLLSRFSWKPKINHYEKYSDAIRMNSKRTVPFKTPETIRKKLIQPWASWRIDRLTTYLNDLTHEEQTTENYLSNIGQLLDQSAIQRDQSFRHTIDDLIEDNLQRHRSFSEQLTQISTLLVHLLGHGNTLREMNSSSKFTMSLPLNHSLSSSPTTTTTTTTRRTKER